MLLAALVVVLGVQAPLVLQPATYASASGRWSLAVDPSERSGTKGGAYRMTADGELAWSAELPVALWRAAVAEDGRVAGYSYSGEFRDPESRFHVVLLSAAGTVLLDETNERGSTGISHTYPVPTGISVFLQPELERFVVYVHLRGGVRACWGYDLATGAALFRRPLELESGIVDGIESSLDVRPVPGTPLVLLHWMTTDYSVDPWDRGAVFELRDEEWRTVWRLDLPHDYEVKGQPEAWRCNEIFAESPILSTAPGRFELRLAAEGQRVTFATSRADTAWTVEEVAHIAYKRPTPVKPPTLAPRLVASEPLGASTPPPAIQTAWLPDFDSIVLKDESSRELQRIERRPDGHWFRMVRAIAAAPDGSLAVLDGPRKGPYALQGLADPVLALYGPRGEPERAFPLPLVTFSGLEYAHGRVLIVGNHEAHVVDTRTGAVHELDLGPALWKEYRPDCSLSADGRELVLADPKQQLRLRYALVE